MLSGFPRAAAMQNHATQPCSSFPYWWGPNMQLHLKETDLIAYCSEYAWRYKSPAALLTPYGSSPFTGNVSSTPAGSPSKSYRNACSCNGASGIPYTLLLEVYRSVGSVPDLRAASRTLKVPSALDSKSNLGFETDSGTETWAAVWTIRLHPLAAVARESASRTLPLTILRFLELGCDLSHSRF